MVVQIVRITLTLLLSLSLSLARYCPSGFTKWMIVSLR